MLNFFRSFFRTIPIPHGDHGGEDETDTELAPLTIRDGWLEGEGVERIPTARTQGLVTHHIQGVVWHWTATSGNARGLAKNIARRPGPTDRSASWHLLIPREGPMLLSAPTTLGTWHAGGPSAARFERAAVLRSTDPTNRRSRDRLWKISSPGTSKISANALFFGIELENIGQVMKVDKQYAIPRAKPITEAWRGWPFGGSSKVPRLGPVVPEAEVAPHSDGGIVRYYHTFTEHQVTQAERVVRALATEYPELAWDDFTWTHRMIDPSRKGDPEPTWPPLLNGILSRVF